MGASSQANSTHPKVQECFQVTAGESKVRKDVLKIRIHVHVHVHVCVAATAPIVSPELYNRFIIHTSTQNRILHVIHILCMYM